MNDDHSLDLYWHAINYRGAATTLMAQNAWTELAACVERIKAAERERCAKLCDDRATRENDGTWTAEEWALVCSSNELAADAIRALPPTD